MCAKKHLVGGFNPSEKYESVEVIILNILKNKFLPNHQPVYINRNAMKFDKTYKKEPLKRSMQTWIIGQT